MKRNLAFGRTNFILLGISMALVIIGFILMGGDSSTAKAFNPDIFSAMRIKVAPIVCLFGFLSMIIAVLYRKKDKDEVTELDVLNDKKIDVLEQVDKTQIDAPKQMEAPKNKKRKR